MLAFRVKMDFGILLISYQVEEALNLAVVVVLFQEVPYVLEEEEYYLMGVEESC